MMRCILFTIALACGAGACARAVGGRGGVSDASVGALDFGVGGNGAGVDLGGGGGGGGGAGGGGGGGGTGGVGGGGGGSGGGGGGGGGGTGGVGGGGGGGAGGGGGGAIDMATAPADMATSGGIITGGPCASGAPGATAIRVRWVNGGGTATVQYEAFGMPDPSRQTVTVSGYQIGFSPPFVDPYLGPGGVGLDDSDFIDVALSAKGITSITQATLALYGRSYDTTASGSFSWQSFSDSGQTATDFVSNVSPYQWYRADIGNTVAAGDSGVLVRVKAGPSSGSLAVNQLEICLVAN